MNGNLEAGGESIGRDVVSVGCGIEKNRNQKQIEIKAIHRPHRGGDRQEMSLSGHPGKRQQT